MKIGVDAGCLGIKDKRLEVGVYQVAKNLLEQLGKIDNINEYILYSFEKIEPKLMKQFGTRMKNTVVKPTRGWTKFALPIKLSIDKIDLFLGLNQSLPQQYSWQKKYKKIVFFYDLAFEQYPQNYRESFKKMHENSAYACINANMLIAISQTTKNDIVRIFNVSSEKIKVSHLGIRAFKDSQKNKSLEEKNKPYFLFVGSYKPGKNIPTLLKAFDIFLKKVRKPYDLLLVGGDKWLDPEIENILNSLHENTQRHIKQVGFLSDRELASLYSHARAFISPSLYEGFGLGFVEAMQFGCPVIGSDIPVLHEVIADAGILVSPLDAKTIAQAMNQIVTDESFARMLREKGKKRAKNFSWEKFAREVIKTY